MDCVFATNTTHHKGRSEQKERLSRFSAVNRDQRLISKTMSPQTKNSLPRGYIFKSSPTLCKLSDWEAN